jgi:coproporphyrinogen III oxidase-like Fe-S oxidoreductase
LLKNNSFPIHNPAYWLGNKYYYAFGMGASSFVNNIRLNRPKSIKKYFDFVHNIEKN